MKRHAIDLTKTAWSHLRGDLTVHGTWWFGNKNGMPRPCIVIIPTFRQSWEKSTPAVVTVDDAWVWSEEIGDGARSARLAFKFAEGLGLDITQATQVFRVASIIREHLGDLQTIRPYDNGKVVVAEAVLTDERGKSVEAVITERV
jgi:hypothetical protein